MAGYHFIERLSWVDAILNAYMILGSMGPVSENRTTSGKIFSSLFALYSGVAFLVITKIIVTLVAHRFLHHLYMDDDSTG